MSHRECDLNRIAACVGIAYCNGVAVSNGEYANRVLVDGLRTRHGEDRRLVGIHNAKQHHIAVALRPAWAGCSQIVDREDQGIGAQETSVRPVPQTCPQCGIDGADRPFKGQQ
ncbi:hypothetical protein HRbin36_01566 [bacterium HR36]|nr:hypothetical protein HRbin36_01566 [bacterium HR36]